MRKPYETQPREAAAGHEVDEIGWDYDAYYPWLHRFPIQITPQDVRK